MTKLLIAFSFPDEMAARLHEKYRSVSFVFCQSKREMLENIQDAQVLMAFSCTKETLEQAKALKWIQALGAGVDALPLDYIKEQGLILTNGKGIHQSHMAEYAIWAMISLARNTHTMFRNQMIRTWNNKVSQGEISGATLGILGLGSIGKKIAEKASALGMHVIGVKRTLEDVSGVERVYGEEDMELVFSQSDYIINLLPHTPRTTGKIDAHFFNLMKKDACFINIGRGATVNEADMIHALERQSIRGVLSDVFTEEPLPPHSPLWGLENVIITPHICGVSPRYTEKALEIIDHNLNAYLNGGEMINVVDLKEGY